MVEKGLVSVIIPTYNREILVKKALDSVLGQTYENFEIIVINDGSTDNTGNILNEYKKQYPDKVFVVNQVNSGQVVARNNGIQSCRGEFVAFLDSDDIWLEDKLEKQMPLFSKRVGLVYCGINEIDGHGNVINTVACQPGMRGNIYHDLLVKNRMTGGSVVITRSSIDKVGLFDTKLQAAENWDLWIRIAKEYLVDYVDEPLINYRKHGGNMSGNSQVMAEATERIFQKHFPVVPVDLTLLEAYNKAYSNYYYQLGMLYFDQEDYSKARVYLKKMKQHGSLPNCANVVILRSFLGKGVNNFITLSKKLIKKMFLL